MNALLDVSYLSIDAANALLVSQAIKISAWNGFEDSDDSRKCDRIYFSPEGEAVALYALSTQIAGWLQAEDWTIIQVDNSTRMDKSESFVFERLVAGTFGNFDSAKHNSLVLRCRDKSDSAYARRTVIAGVIFHALVFGWHIHLASAGEAHGQRMAVQDGVVAFHGPSQDVAAARQIMSNFQHRPFVCADWVYPERDGT